MGNHLTRIPAKNITYTRKRKCWSRYVNTLSTERRVRSYENTKITTNITINKLILHEYSQVLKKQFELLHELQHKDIKLKRIIDRIQSAPNKYFVIYQNLLFSTNGKNKYRLMIPEVMKHQLIHETPIFGTRRNV